MRHFSEEELIAYQLDECEGADEIRLHLNGCDACSATSDAIAETLRVFSAEPVPAVDFERNWQRVRGSLAVLEPESRRFDWLRTGWAWGAAGLAVTAVLVLAVLLGVYVRRGFVHKPNYAINGHGPLTTQPVDVAIAGHLDAAERLLTEVNHASGPLDDATRDQARDLLLKNAVYVSSAHEQGDVAEAAVLERLGRVLMTIDHEPNHESGNGDAKSHAAQGKDDADGPTFRLEMNTGGLLLEIRILRQNDEHSQ